MLTLMWMSHPQEPNVGAGCEGDWLWGVFLKAHAYKQLAAEDTATAAAVTAIGSHMMLYICRRTSHEAPC